MLFNRGAAVRKIDQKTAKEMIDKGNVTIVDVRTPGEFAQGYIPGAVSLPLDRISLDAGKVLPDKGATLLVYCLSGNRSRTASSMLARSGYKNVCDFGGIGTWPYGITRK